MGGGGEKREQKKMSPIRSGNTLESIIKTKGTRQGQWKQHWQWLL